MEKTAPTNIPWSLRIGRLFGIDVYVHFTFILLLAFIGIAQWVRTGDMTAILTGIGFIAALFACVVLHEFGHALTARKYGIVTRDITLLPIGGLARLERMPEKPIQEFWVALAGPAVNVVIAAVIMGWLSATSSLVPPESLAITGGSFLQKLAAVNILLVVFNMLPAFPMDGGRVLRALLATRLDYTRATGIAARIGQFLAFGFGFIGLFSNPFLVLIALFVWVGAEQEYGMVRVKAALAGVPMRKLMITDFHTLHPADKLDVAVTHILGGFQQDFPVIEESGNLVGILSHSDLIRTLADGGVMTPVRDVMRQEFETVDASDSTDGLLSKFQGRDCQTVPVMGDGHLVGLLTPRNLSEFLMVRDAIESSKSHPSAKAISGPGAVDQTPPAFRRGSGL